MSESLKKLREDLAQLLVRQKHLDDRVRSAGLPVPNGVVIAVHAATSQLRTALQAFDALEKLMAEQAEAEKAKKEADGAT